MSLPVGDGWALGVSYAYVGAVAAAAELLRRFRGCSREAARKIVHVGVGLFVIPTVFLFSDWRIAVIPPLSFAVVNFVIHRFRLLPALDAEPLNFGTVFFPLSFAALLALFFRPGSHEDLSAVAVAGVLSMALGDAAAAEFGRRYGTRRYTILGHSRTMEGSLAMFLVSGAAIAVTLVALGGFGAHAAVAFGLVVGTAAAGLEAVSPFGSDNLTVPLGSAGILTILLQISESALGIN